jgi:hypothetical protein
MRSVSFTAAAATGLLALCLLVLLAPEAQADHRWKRNHWGPGWAGPGWHGSHFHGGHRHFRGRHGRHSGVGASIVFGSPRTLYVERPPRVVYVDPPPVVVESPGYPEPRYAGPGEEARYCREVNKTVLIDGRLQNAYGKACYQPDGSWQWVDD